MKNKIFAKFQRIQRGQNFLSKSISGICKEKIISIKLSEAFVFTYRL